MNNTLFTSTTMELDHSIISAEYITSHIIPVLQRPSEDETIMKDRFLDMELIFKVILADDETGTTSYKLTKVLAELHNMDIDFLKKCAGNNVSEKVTCQSIGEIFGYPETDTDMYVISNESKNWGAGAAFICTDKLKELADKWQTEEIIILPSSVHEILAVKPDTADPDFYNAMICSVNSECVDEAEQLSSHHYKYHANSNSFSF